MIMKNIIIIAACAFISATTLSSCNKWLDVLPQSQVNEESQFSTPDGFQQVLSGCYLSMTETNLYGAQLLFVVPERIVQNYEAGTNQTEHNGAGFQSFNYKSIYTKPIVEGIWLDSYNVISNANKALEQFENGRDEVLNPIEKSVIKGELLAIRGYMHFNLLRYFGYGNLAAGGFDFSKLTIPYITSSSKDFVPQQSYEATIKLMIKDFEDAIELLEKDPIYVDNTGSDYDLVNINGFYNYRQMRINAFAAKAMLAQVYMWEGSDESLTEAQKLCADIIEYNKANNIFEWVVGSEYETELDLSPEHLFGVNNINLSSVSVFMPEYFFDNNYDVLIVSSNMVSTLYDEASIDNRVISLLLPYDGDYVSRKYTVKTGAPVIELVTPVVRLSEVYFMAAECAAKLDNDLSEASKLVYEVRANRGCLNSIPNSTLEEFMDNLIQEYRREFICEGVSYYAFKRLGVTEIKNSENGTVEITDDNYILPYPDFELQSGRVQF